MPVTQRQIHPVDVPKTQLSVEYGLGEFIGHRIFQTSISEKYTVRYFVKKQGQQRLTDYTWQQGTDRPLSKVEWSSQTAVIDEFAPTDYIRDKDRNDADPPLQLDNDITLELTKELMVNYEAAVVTKATTAANYPTNGKTQLSGTSQWSDKANSDPIKNIMTGIKWVALQTGLPPQRMGLAMGFTTWFYLAQHPAILDFFKRQDIKMPIASDLTGMFDIGEVIVGSASYNSAKEGQTVTQAWLWDTVTTSGSALIYALPPPGGPGLRTMQYGVSHRVRQNGGGTRVVETWRDANKRADFISVVDSWHIDFTAQDSTGDALAGYLIYDTWT